MKDGQITSSPGADLHRLEREHERIGAVGDADRVGHAEIGGRLALERLDLGTEDEAAGLEHLGEALLQLRDQRRVLRLDVDERNHDRIECSDGSGADPSTAARRRRLDLVGQPHNPPEPLQRLLVDR